MLFNPEPNTHIELPEGVIEIVQPIVLKPGVTIVGKGKSTTIIRKSPSFVGDALVLNEKPPTSFDRHLSVRDLTLDGVDRTINGVMLDRAAETDFRNVEIGNCDYGAKITDSIVTKFDHCKIHTNRIGLSGVFKVTSLTVQSTRIQASKEHNVEIDGPGTFGIQFLLAIIESSGIDTLNSPGLIIGEVNGEVKGCTILGSYFEGNKSGTRAQIEIGSENANSVSRASLIGCFITGGVKGKADYGLHLIKGRPVVIVGCDFSAHDVSSIKVDAAARDSFEAVNVFDVNGVTGDGVFRYELVDLDP